ncbi:MAG: nucleotidyltransferase domain-containing protein [Alphaproteobacteria bacterium]|nr:nucleotidyltransferase domain-containing protein [Alphaproteobacteria bacterium]
MTDQQRRMLIDSRQLWAAWVDAARRRDSYRGGMSWKTVGGHTYLVKMFPDSVSGVKKMVSVGPRSAETERILSDFQRNKAEAKERLESLNRRLSEQGRLNKAVYLGRVPTIAAKILRRLHRAGLLGRNVFVTGTHAIHAYEAAAGVMLDRDLTATGDLDLMMEARAKLRLSISGLPVGGLIDLLAEVDRSFVKQGAFSAVNRDGYAVDLIKATPTPPWLDETSSFAAGDLEAAMIGNLRWVQHAPKFDGVAIAEDGLPVPMACPDPRAYALYKLWMGTNDPDRDPVKRPRDLAQAEAVATIVHRWLPQLPFEPEHLKCFPRAAIDLGRDQTDPFFR